MTLWPYGLVALRPYGLVALWPYTLVALWYVAIAFYPIRSIAHWTVVHDHGLWSIAMAIDIYMAYGCF